MQTVQLVLAVHNHQPVGNFDFVFEDACDRAYRPFLDCMAAYPDLPFVLHVSGSLLEWMEEHRPELVQRLAGMARSGRVEMLGGGYYEPILTMLPERDRVGQITSYSRHLRHRLGATVRGAWIAERVWEPCLASTLVDSGIEYTVVDDFHFKCAGLRSDHLYGYYITEDQGRVLRVFPGSEKLRYTIPFADPQKTIDYLASVATDAGERVVVYADDGEKFGGWPKTYKHVYEDRWLTRFLDALQANSDWIRVRTFADVVADTAPLGKVYLPDASYREMTEWVLPVDTSREFEALQEDLKVAGLLERTRPFVRGGTWRNFRAKYVEAAQMYARMVEASEAVDKSRAPVSRRERARMALYRGQCNCGYWHGVFGGLYLPFLRFETYRHLLEADRLVGGQRSRPTVDVADFDLDGRHEIRWTTPGVKLYLKPDRGGHIYEWDDMEKSLNLMAYLTRREEAYHAKLIERMHKPHEPQSEVASIHDRITVKEEGLAQHLVYDDYVRDSLIDHIFAPGASLGSVASGQAAELGTWASAPYECRRLKRSAVVLECAAGPARIEKRVSPEGDRGFAIDVHVRPEAEAEGATYAMEFNVGLLAGDAPDRYYTDAAGSRLGPLRSRLDLEAQEGIALVDEWLGVEFWLRPEPPAGVWAYPVETVSESEGGFERVYQNSAVLLRWPLRGDRQFVVHVEVKHR